MLSVVIPVRDGAAVIGRCLRALTELETAGQPFEVIVVDNGSRDETVGVARLLGRGLNLSILTRPGVHVSAVRNAGAACARGNLFAFLDADCVVAKTWLLRATEYGWNEHSGAIGAFFGAGPEAGWVARTWCRFEGAGKRGPVDLLPSGNMIVPRRVFEAAGGFDESLETNEDADFCRRLSASGLRVEAVAELQAIHLGAPRSVAELYARELWHGKDVFPVFLRRCGNARAVGFAVYVLFWSACLIVAAAYWGSTGRPQSAAVSLAALAAAPAAISLRAVLRSGKWGDFIPLTFLLAVYGAARAAALLGYRAHRPCTNRPAAENVKVGVAD